jgi:hypothetical protein
MTETFDLMPNAAKTPEGVERMTKAANQLNDAVSRCANEFRNLVDILGLPGLRTTLTADLGMDDTEADEICDGVAEALDAWTNAGEELLRSVGGHPPAAAESVRYRRSN